MAYTQEQKDKIFDTICERISNGESVNTICKEKDMPDRTTFYKWLNEDDKTKNKEKVNKYARATELRADALFDEIIVISDTTIQGKETITKVDGKKETKEGDMLGHRKLQIDSRKWVASKLNPKKYGDKLEIDQTITEKRISKVKVHRPKKDE